MVTNQSVKRLAGNCLRQGNVYFVDLYIQNMFVHKKHVVTLFVRHLACTLLRPQEVVVQTCSSARYSICIHPLKAVTTMFCQICGLQHVEATDMCSPEVALNCLSSKLVRPKVCVAPLCSITNVCHNLWFPLCCQPSRAVRLKRIWPVCLVGNQELRHS